jgi:SAM-dependent methyltransferase
MPEILQTRSETAYYDQRFTEGYADFWPPGRYTRIAALLGGLSLADTGSALDFGCGNGSFTRLLTDTLRGWTVAGADVSRVALQHAAAAAPTAAFLPVDALRDSGRKFDLIFSHHVLEHVPDLDATIRLLAEIASPAATLLLVMPCGNPGSLEHTLCRLRTDGIDRSREDRFFCDDGPHVRRATSDRLASIGAANGFELRQAFFSQHFWSQLWPYAQKPFAELAALTDWRKAVSAGAAVRLLAYRALFLAVAAVSLPTLYRWRLEPRADRRASDHVRHAAALALAPLSTPASRLLRRLDEREWRLRRHTPAGAERYLVFRRRAAAGSRPAQDATHVAPPRAV